MGNSDLNHTMKADRKYTGDKKKRLIALLGALCK